MAALALLAGLSAMWALNASEALFVAVRWMSIGSYLLLCQILLTRWPDSLLQIFKVIMVALSGLAIFGLLQANGIHIFNLSDGHNSPTGFQANRNFYGSALFLGIPFSIYAFFRSALGWKIGAVAAIALMIVGIVVAGTRSALVPLLLAAILFPPVIIAKRLKGKMRLFAGCIWLLIVVVSFWASSFVLKKKEAKIHYALLWEHGKIVTPNSSSLDFRLIGWHHSITMGKERPLLGQGAGNWKMEIQRLGLQSFDEDGNFGMVVPLHPHNEFLVTFAELGVPGLMLFLAIWGIGIGGAMRMMHNRNGQHDSLLGAILLLAWLGILVDANFSFPLERPLHFMLFGLLLALSMQGWRSQTISANRLRILLMGAFFLLLFAGANVASRMVVDVQIRQIRDAKALHQPQKILKLAPKATNWATQIDPVAALSIDWYVTMAEIELGHLDLAMAAIERASQISPNHLAQRSARASLLDMSGRSREAIDVQSELLTVYPNFTEGWINLSIMQVHAGRLTDARASLDHAVRAEMPAAYDQVDNVLRQSQH